METATYLSEFYSVSDCITKYPTKFFTLLEVKAYCKEHDLFAKVYKERTDAIDKFDYCLPNGEMFALVGYVLPNGKCLIARDNPPTILL